jgi:sugar phosphate isomerase/epimerase
MSHLLLKARPTPAQLADRLRAPRPDGLELYLDLQDLADERAVARTLAAVETCGLAASDVLLIEGPIRSLDGGYFDLTRESEADRALVDRLAELARRLSARAVNVHLIAPRPSQAGLTLEARRAALTRSLAPAGYFAERVAQAGAIPTVENMPPVLRMRESTFYYSSIGLAAEDLVWICERVPGLRATLDLSHAGLYLNCRQYARGPQIAEDAPPGAYDRLYRFVDDLPPVDDLLDYAGALAGHLETVHVANAQGLLGEGAPYDQGDFDLDLTVSALAPRVSFFVTETLERDHDRAVEMRRALGAMRTALAAPSQA